MNRRRACTIFAAACSPLACLGQSEPGPTTGPSTTQSTTTQASATQPATTQSSATRPFAFRHPPESVPPALAGIVEGTYLAGRVGRLRFNPTGPYPHFDFWEKGQRVRVDLLPDRDLMAMEQAAFWDDHLRFRVSGRITNYNGKDYLLVQRVTKVLPTSAPATSRPTSQPTTDTTTRPQTPA